MANIDPGEASTSDIQAVARVGQICGLFGPRVVELTAADVGERTGLNRTTAYRYCASMVAAGLLERGARRGTFALGPLMLELGTLALGRRRVVELARPHLRKLSTAVRMTAVLSTPGAQGPVVTLVEEDTSRVVVVTVRTGEKLGPFAAQGLLFLAYSDGTPMHQTVAGLTAADRARLEAEIETVRQRGFSFVRRGGGPFVMAAPIFDATGLCATIAVLSAGDADDLSPAHEQLLATAAALSDDLGAPAAAEA
jgi:DNA-binding IclR family transcriptional regulator